MVTGIGLARQVQNRHSSVCPQNLILNVFLAFIIGYVIMHVRIPHTTAIASLYMKRNLWCLRSAPYTDIYSTFASYCSQNNA